VKVGVSVTRRAARLIAVLAIALGALVGLPAATGVAHADTPTINCDDAQSGRTSADRADWSTCQELVGTAQCVWNNGRGSYTIALGYNNPTSSNLYASIPVDGQGGANNSLTANGGYAENPDHVSTFWTGVSETAFTVTWSPTRRQPYVTWQLMGQTYNFSTTSVPACQTKPVPIMGNGLAIGLGLGLLVLAMLAVNRRSVSRLRVTHWLRHTA
jgi:hypothetical protein